MTIHVTDTKGLICPIPIMMVELKAAGEVREGDVLEVVADCKTFENDIRAWCVRNNKVLLFVRDEGGGVTRARIQF